MEEDEKRFEIILTLLKGIDVRLQRLEHNIENRIAALEQRVSEIEKRIV
jgi:hypothetical protein